MTQTEHEENVQIPLHRKIAESLSQQVSNGKFKPGQRLPSERQIARQFQASRATVRTALQHLEQSGLITRRERRSALVSIRRDIAPAIRIACSSYRLSTLFGRLSEMQMLPARCQLQLLDLQQPAMLGRMVTHPSLSADVIICDLDYVECFKSNPNYYHPLPMSDFSDFQFHQAAQSICLSADQYTAIPLGISPMMLYLNRGALRERQIEPSFSDWNWDRFEQAANELTTQGRYGFQIRPSLSHLNCLMRSFSGEFYQSEGYVNHTETGIFEHVLRRLHAMLHVRRISPLLAKVDQINLFAQRRCGMALDGFEMLGMYRESLGEDLAVSILPRPAAMPGTLNGFAMVILPGLENLQPVQELVHKLLSGNTQRVMTQISGAMPIRGDMLNLETFEEIQIPRTMAQAFLQELNRCQPSRMSPSLDYKNAVENLILELWLGLDSIENILHRIKKIDL